MSFRVTPNIFTSHATASIAERNSRLAELQRQASSGLRIERPSDDPQAVRSLLRQAIADQRFDARLGVISDVRATLDHAVTNLGSAHDIFAKAKEIAITANQSFQTDQREIHAEEVEALLARLLSIANIEVDGRYLFGGTSIDRRPFDPQNTLDGQMAAVNYVGSSEPMQVAVDPRTTIDTFVPGTDVFSFVDRRATIFGSNTGIAAGTGTDSNTGLGTVLIQHTLTTYGVGSGVQPGTDSVQSDTIIGLVGTHVLTVDDTSGTGAAGTVSLNGGASVPFSSGDTNLRVEGQGGEVVFVDTTSITPGFQGDVSIAADGTISIDNGVTAIPIDFSGNQIVVDGASGQVTNVDTSNVRRSGTDYAEYVGTADAFQTLIELRDDLRNTRGLPEREWHEAIARRHLDVDRVFGAISQAVASHSVQLANLESLENRISEVQLETRRLIDEIQAADIATVAIELQSEQNLLQYTLATSASLINTSLLDFLR